MDKRGDLGAMSGTYSKFIHKQILAADPLIKLHRADYRKRYNRNQI